MLVISIWLCMAGFRQLSSKDAMGMSLQEKRLLVRAGLEKAVKKRPKLEIWGIGRKKLYKTKKAVESAIISMYWKFVTGEEVWQKS